MKILTAEQMRNVELFAAQNGIDFLRLMENAGSACAYYIRNNYKITPETPKRVTIVCGRGKNGGDGFVIARKLQENGGIVKVILASGNPSAANALEMFSRLQDLPIPILRLDFEHQESLDAISDTDILVDTVFGVGFYGQPSEDMAELFALMSNSKGIKVAVDVPSGVDCDSGAVNGNCVRADVTIAIANLKPAHVVLPAAEFCGETTVVGIGIPDEAYDYVDSDLYTLKEKDIKNKFVPRQAVSHKGTYGHVLSVCGSRSMVGAAVLAATGAVRSGAGLVTAAFPECAYTAIASHLVEPLLLPLHENASGTIGAGALPQLLSMAEKVNVLLIGCGLGLNEDTKNIVYNLIEQVKCPIIIDADGINALSFNIDILKASRAPIVLTPHPGEMARLENTSIQKIQANRMNIAREFANNYGVTLVLKGANTIVAPPNGSRYINRTGNAGMAKGGCGDLLSGMIAGFIAQGMSVEDACVSAVYLHGLAGDSVANNLSQRGMTPSDMANYLPLLLSNFES